MFIYVYVCDNWLQVWVIRSLVVLYVAVSVCVLGIGHVCMQWWYFWYLYGNYIQRFLFQSLEHVSKNTFLFLHCYSSAIWLSRSYIPNKRINRILKPRLVPLPEIMRIQSRVSSSPLWNSARVQSFTPFWKSALAFMLHHLIFDRKKKKQHFNSSVLDGWDAGEEVCFRQSHAGKICQPSGVTFTPIIV